MIDDNDDLYRPTPAGAVWMSIVGNDEGNVLVHTYLIEKNGNTAYRIDEDVAVQFGVKADNGYEFLIVPPYELEELANKLAEFFGVKKVEVR